MALPTSAFMQGVKKLTLKALLNLDSYDRAIAEEVGATSCKAEVAMI